MTTYHLSNGHPEDSQLESLLLAYARADLNPDPARMARMRADLVAATRRQYVRPTLAHRVMKGVTGWGGRRPALAFLAAGLTLLMLAGGTLAASRAGGPLYDTRLVLESLTLPSDPGARTDAELIRLQNRLDEASDGAVHGNGEAVTAALDAYRRILDEAIAAAGDDLDRDTRLELELERHQVVLTTLVGLLPDRAAEAIQRVLDRQQGTIQSIKAKGEQDGNPPAQGQGGGPGQGQGSSPGQGQGGSPGQGQGGNSGGGSGGAVPTARPSHPDRPSPAPPTDHPKAP